MSDQQGEADSHVNRRKKTPISGVFRNASKWDYFSINQVEKKVLGTMKNRIVFAAILLPLALLTFLVERKLVKLPHFEYFSNKCDQKKVETELQKNINEVFQKIDSIIPKIRFSHIDHTTSAQRSIATIKNPRNVYCVGDTLIVQVDSFDFLGNRKTFGGDFLLARIYSPEINAGASGRVEDFGNGTYHIHFKLFWAGAVNVSILLIHPSEGVSALWRARNKGYGYIAYTGYFSFQGKEAKTKCGFNLSKTEELCEYSDPKEEEYFYCIKPANMPCGSLASLASNYVDSHSYLSDLEKPLFTRSNILVQIPNSFEKLFVSSCGSISQQPQQKCRAGMEYQFPGGYFYQNMWYHLSCNISRYRGKENINKCLQGRIVYLIGDSTIRQWMNYITSNSNSLKPFDLHGSNWAKTLLSVDTEHNIKIEWRKHANPFITLVFHTFKEEFTIPHQIDQIGGDSYTVIAFTIGAHFRSYPIEPFIRRVINIRRAIEKLLLRSPDTKVIIKTENSSGVTKKVEEMFSDFHGYIHYLIINDIFKDLKVSFVDAWDMTNAFASNNMHPPVEVISNEIDLFLNYVC
ncbi:NXPE family member 4-like [Bombina bombina]|uniref:NXPE family member 4-like n=1 Tax=Bombina bombina TaxID=8345 RepID=UPI00235B0DCA|nr:NXPE family member 4-like [Bombina bombina]